MNTYPTTPRPRVGTKDTKIIPILKSESEGNYIRVRRRATKSRMKFTLRYNALTEAEFNTLDAFFDANQGQIFEFTHPVSLTTYNCVFNQDELEKDYVSKGIINTDIILEEA